MLTTKCTLCQRPFNSKRRKLCPSCNTRIRRFRVKLKAVQLLGGKCSCGYSLKRNFSNLAAFDLHHVGKKDFLISSSAHKTWSVIKRELKRCELKCANCHKILHSDYSKPLVEKSLDFGRTLFN